MKTENPWDKHSRKLKRDIIDIARKFVKNISCRCTELPVGQGCYRCALWSKFNSLDVGTALSKKLNKARRNHDLCTLR